MVKLVAHGPLLTRPAKFVCVLLVTASLFIFFTQFDLKKNHDSDLI
jgi:hypothetical protein